MKAFIDLHCDTLTCEKNISGEAIFDNPDCRLTLGKIPACASWAQFYALYTPDTLCGKAAIEHYEKYKRIFYSQLEKYNARVAMCRNISDLDKAWQSQRVGAFFSIENANVLGGSLERIPILAADGVRCATLTWNGKNELGSGHDTNEGLTAFGKSAISQLEKNGILVDCSHLNDKGFYELLSVAKRPFLATHSNSRSVCGHKRNLTDEMITEMVRRKCLIGLNYYVSFLSEDICENGMKSLLRHVVHLLELGAEECIALGSDYDGATIPKELDSPEKLQGLRELFVSNGITESVADAILYKNAYSFLRENLK